MAGDKFFTPKKHEVMNFKTKEIEIEGKILKYNSISNKQNSIFFTDINYVYVGKKGKYYYFLNQKL